MTEERADGSSWLRAERRRKTNPEDRTADREALKRRLFGTPQPQPSSETDDGPDAA
ncbi:MAG: hypothetical protein WKF51_11530 [Geodermatophilaceae bacterium]